MNQNLVRECLAEFLGTFFLIFFGCGSMILAQVSSDYDAGFIPIIWGASVCVLIYAFSQVGGAHFNPAVSISFFFMKLLKLPKLISYIIFQCLGAVSASFFHGMIWPTSHDFGMTHAHITYEMSFAVEFTLSFFLMYVIMSFSHKARADRSFAGFAIGLSVALCSFVGGPLTNASMNPARSLAPALMFGSFHHLWIFIFAPILGAVFGSVTYVFLQQPSYSTDDI